MTNQIDTKTFTVDYWSPFVSNNTLEIDRPGDGNETIVHLDDP